MHLFGEENTRELLLLAVLLALLLACKSSSGKTEKLAGMFNVLGDALALLALEEC